MLKLRKNLLRKNQKNNCMKVEIDVNDLDAIKQEREVYKNRVSFLEEKIKELDEIKLVERAIDLSYDLLQMYIGTIFKKLGFDDPIKNRYNAVRFDVQDILAKHGKYWFNAPELLDIEVEAKLAENLKLAFLKIGVNADAFKKEQKEEIKLPE